MIRVISDTVSLGMAWTTVLTRGKHLTSFVWRGKTLSDVVTHAQSGIGKGTLRGVGCVVWVDGWVRTETSLQQGLVRNEGPFEGAWSLEEQAAWKPEAWVFGQQEGDE